MAEEADRPAVPVPAKAKAAAAVDAVGAVRKLAEAGGEVEAASKAVEAASKAVVVDAVVGEDVAVVAEEPAGLLVKWRFSGNTKCSLWTPSLH